MSELVLNMSCVAIGEWAILIEGPSGSGKSSLALALIDRGATLVGDDAVLLEPREGHLYAAAPPREAGQIEIRNVGLVTMPVTSARVGLAVRLSERAPRFREESDAAKFCGIAIPSIALHPQLPSLPLRAEYALRKYGLI